MVVLALLAVSFAISVVTTGTVRFVTALTFGLTLSMLVGAAMRASYAPINSEAARKRRFDDAP
jgi:hypothetical protein